MTRTELDRLVESRTDVELEELAEAVVRERQRRERAALRAVQGAWQMAGAR